MTRIPPPDPPYEGPAAHVSAGDNMPIHRIVLHSTVSPCKAGGRHDIARYFRSPEAGGSANYVTDPVDAVQVVGDHQIAWHAPPNQHSLGVEMCDMPVPVPPLPLRPLKRLFWRWRRPEQQAMLHVTAQLVAQLCLAYGVPIRWLSVRALRRGRHGITVHANVSRAFKQSDHWDPGFWPRRQFMALVDAYATQLRRDHAHD